MKAVTLCFKTWLKPDEAMIYCNLNRTQFLSKCRLFGISKNNSGYFSREDLDKMLCGEYISLSQRWDDLLKKGRDGTSSRNNEAEKFRAWHSFFFLMIFSLKFFLRYLLLSCGNTIFPGSKYHHC
jgi:hypothetical protein